MSLSFKTFTKGTLAALFAILFCALLLMPKSGIASAISLAILAYGLGSIPSGYLLVWFATKRNIRTIGSHNIGATNVLRAGHKGLAALTLLLDATKGAGAIFLISHYHSQDPIAYVLAGFPILGHLFPVWLDFKGGKGVATGLGVLAALSWKVALLGIATWFLTALTSRYSSLAALVAATAVPLYAYLLDENSLIFFTFALCLVIYIRHHENIRRLLRGEESKIGH